ARRRQPDGSRGRTVRAPELGNQGAVVLPDEESLAFPNPPLDGCVEALIADAEVTDHAGAGHRAVGGPWLEAVWPIRAGEEGAAADRHQLRGGSPAGSRTEVLDHPGPLGRAVGRPQLGAVRA